MLNILKVPGDRDTGWEVIEEMQDPDCISGMELLAGSNVRDCKKKARRTGG